MIYGKTKIRFLLTACLLIAPSLGLALETSTNGPRAFLPESVYEFQPVLEGVQVSHEFILGNQGDEPLQIIHIKSD